MDKLAIKKKQLFVHVSLHYVDHYCIGVKKKLNKNSQPLLRFRIKKNDTQNLLELLNQVEENIDIIVSNDESHTETLLPVKNLQTAYQITQMIKEGSQLEYKDIRTEVLLNEGRCMDEERTDRKNKNKKIIKSLQKNFKSDSRYL